MVRICPALAAGTLSQGLKPAKVAGSDVEAEASTYLRSNRKSNCKGNGKLRGVSIALNRSDQISRQRALPTTFCQPLPANRF